MGVDLFFVLSGYLITLGLVAPTEGVTVGKRIGDFYARRALRIFPLYYAAIAIGSVICVLAKVSPPGPAFWLYVHNYAQARDLHLEVWTGHLWSLAIEEQFYLVWPAAMLLLPRARLRVTAALLVLGVAARALVIFAGGMDSAHASHFVYRATFTHADGLLVGAMVAIVEGSAPAPSWRRLRMPLVALASLAYVAPQIASSNEEDAFARVALCVEPLMLACVFSVVVSFAVEGTAVPNLARVLSSRALRACGRVSYGMYMLHWPLLLLVLPWLRRANDSLSPWGATLFELGFVACAIPIVFGIAQLSYRFFESPLLALKARFSA